jgi:hypothetical protein
MITRPLLKAHQMAYLGEMEGNSQENLRRLSFLERVTYVLNTPVAGNNNLGSNYSW